MLESFLVEGRQDLGDGRAADLRPVDHRRLHRLGATRSRLLDRLAAAVEAARAGATAMRIAVLGVGPDRRLDRARRAASGSSAEVVGLRPRPGDARAGGRARRDRPRRRARSPRPARAPRWSSARRRWRRCPSSPREALAACGPETRRHRRRLDQARARRRARRRRALHRRPPAGRRRDRRGRERPRRPLRGRPLVPDPDRALRAASSTTACSGPSPASAPGRRRSTPRPTTA